MYLLDRLYAALYKRQAKKYGNQAICWNCFRLLIDSEMVESVQSLAISVCPSHRLRIDHSTVINVLCSVCNYRLSKSEKIRIYRIWFRFFSGLPDFSWSKVVQAIHDEDENFGL